MAMTMEEAMRARHMVRRYTGEPLSEEHVRLLEERIDLVRVADESLGFLLAAIENSARPICVELFGHGNLLNREATDDAVLENNYTHARHLRRELETRCESRNGSTRISLLAYLGNHLTHFS